LISATAAGFSNEDLVILLEIQEELVAFGASFVGVVYTVAEQYRWCRTIHNLWHKLARDRTEKVMSLIQGNNGAIPQ